MNKTLNWYFKAILVSAAIGKNPYSMIVTCIGLE